MNHEELKELSRLADMAAHYEGPWVSTGAPALPFDVVLGGRWGVTRISSNWRYRKAPVLDARLTDGPRCDSVVVSPDVDSKLGDKGGLPEDCADGREKSDARNTPKVDGMSQPPQC